MTQRHVTPNERGGGWQVSAPSSTQPDARTSTQAGAIAEAEDKVRRSGGGHVLIHGLDGGIRDRRTVISSS